MKLGVNYLMELRELIPEGKIDYIDYIKLYSIDEDLTPFDWCLSQKNVMFHGYVGHGSNIADIDFLENRDNELQKDYYERGNTPYVSSHINRGVLDDAGEAEVTERIAKNVKELKEIFGMRVVLENVPATDKRKHSEFLYHPEYIAKVVRENNCGFLFDFGHARSAAEYLNIPFDKYLAELPMEKLIEVHLSGCMKKKDGTLSPNHSKMNEEDYELFESILKNCPTLEVVTLEYGPYDFDYLEERSLNVSGSEINQDIKRELHEQIERIYGLMKKYNLK